jgi:hypothetical protein
VADADPAGAAHSRRLVHGEAVWILLERFEQQTERIRRLPGAA